MEHEELALRPFEYVSSEERRLAELKRFFEMTGIDHDRGVTYVTLILSLRGQPWWRDAMKGTLKQ